MVKRPMEIEQYAIKLLSFRARSEYEMRQRLEHKNYPPRDIDQLIKKLKSKNLINDAEFALSWITNRDTLKPTGKRLLFMELKNKGIDKEIIEQVLSYDDDHELELAKTVAEKKGQRLQGEIWQKKQKLLALLSRRGFNYNISRQAVDEYFTK